MRRLIHIPIIHSAVDLGSLSESVRAHYAKVVGQRAWSQREQVVRSVWKHVQRSIQALDLDYRRVRIYQDGLPVCGFEERIVRELADAGSPNHQLILQLIEEGATLEGTEDPQLLIEEYEMQKQGPASAAVSDRMRKGRMHKPERLLAARDAAIAQRIDATLRPGETGLLFLGALHRMDGLRPTGIRVATLGVESNEAIRRPGT
jgi:hypothetical protein